MLFGVFNTIDDVRNFVHLYISRLIDVDVYFLRLKIINAYLIILAWGSDLCPGRRQRSQQLVTFLSLTVIHPLGNRGFLPTGKMNFPGSRVEVV
jgi:hypothetical protein